MPASFDLAPLLTALGLILLLGLATEAIGRWTPLPRVTLLLLFGALMGPPVLNLLPQVSEAWISGVSTFALIMIGFLIGGSLTVSALRIHGRLILQLSAAVTLVTVFVMLSGLYLLGFILPTALLLAGIATATDPAATVDVIRSSNSKTPFSRVLMGIVAIDDAWGLIMFSLMLALAMTISGQAETGPSVGSIIHEIGGAVVLGGALGLPMAYLTGRIKKGEPTQAEALGLVLLCGGLAMRFEVSHLLAAMTMGAVVANLARHHKRPFHAIERIEWPFLILFFVLAGASFKIDSFAQIGYLGSAYILLRIIGRIAGGWVGGYIGDTPPQWRTWTGLALMPQAGVALGMALIAVQRFPHLRETLLPVIVGATIFFEITGPVLTRMALNRTGR